jgi:uncharacterized membrane protein YhhN
MGPTTVMLIVVCLLATASLIFAEYTGNATLRTGSKLVASGAFLGLGLPALGASPFHTWMVVGLIFGAIGDVALLGRSTRAFVGGLAAFLVGHLAYVIAFAQLESPAYWIIYAGRIGMIAIAGGAFSLRWLWPHLGKLKTPVVLYVIAIVLMVLGAFSIRSTGGLPAPERELLALGAALFFLSDLAVARERFVARDFKNKLYGLPAYFVAQLLIASAIN